MTMTDAPYHDTFEARVAPNSRSAEQWARAIFEDAPLAVRWFVVIGWRFGLALRLGPRPSPDHVLGWKIVTVAPDRITLGARSGILGQAQLVVHVEPSRIAVATVVRFKHRGARAIWSVVGLIHRRILPYLLNRAANSYRA
jgi:hypothetical protein